MLCKSKILGRETHWFVGDDVFANGEAHAGAKRKRRSHGTRNNSASAHDP